jgi:2'-5' RNA ligase
MKESYPLYFIALIPPEPLRSRIAELKDAFACQYNSRHALKSPPHVTLVPPFRADANEHERLISHLKVQASRQTEFELQIEGYGAFKPRVIYLDVQDSESALGLMQKLLSIVMPERQSKKGKLHITLATRDLSTDMFYKAWKASKDLSFSESFLVDRLYFLKHDGAKWQIEEEFQFRT